MEKKIEYPLGIQTFEEIRKKGYLYVDKTELIYNLVNGNKKEKGYADRYMADRRTIFIIGANFSTHTGKLTSYLVEKLK